MRREHLNKEPLWNLQMHELARCKTDGVLLKDAVATSSLSNFQQVSEAKR